ncbi:Crp/Fnr family transcriptional regulator [Pseudonocardia lutea]|uniref:Crp/Fnr family transcriptional regulator n=1 Tax=Pseudonocardia lutea TaxID=2172015 RepID=A0ABW1IJ25_9PSEU
MTVELIAEESPEAATALSRSWYANLSPEAEHGLLSSATNLKLERGEYLPEIPEASHAGIVVSGLLRVCVRKGERQVTLHYAEPSDPFGIPDLGNSAEIGITTAAQALVDTRVMVFSRMAILQLLEADPKLSYALIRSLRGILRDSVLLLAENVLAPVHQRVARHLLDLAVREADGSVVVHATVRDLADATGTVREVVTRALKGMRERGLIGRVDGALVLHDMHRIHLIAKGAADS